MFSESRASYFQRVTAGMSAHHENGVLLVDSGLPCDTFNLVCLARLEQASLVTRTVHSVIRYFAVRSLPFSWWNCPSDEPQNLGELLEAGGLVRAESELAMVADLERMSSDRIEYGELRIERVSSHTQLRDFANVVAANWNPPDRHVINFYERARPAALDPSCPISLFVGYLGDTPVATSELTLDDQIVGIYGVAVLSEYRRRGYGSVLTAWPLFQAKAKGYGTAVLQASAAGVGVYERLGFRAYAEVTEYKPVYT